tara:strand:- start:200997 stop:201551 length:555 start_codon:yes stop_codon:yes gene_type:complete
MTLISRISRLFKADFHAVLDQVEEPQLLLKQAIREMEEALHAGEVRVREVLVEQEGLKVRHEEMQQALVNIDEELDICFQEEKSELARELIKRKLQTRRVMKCLAARLEAAEKTVLESKKVLADNRATLAGARQKAELFTDRFSQRGCEGSPTDDTGWNPGESLISDNDVEVAFLREKKRRVQS